MTARVVLGVTSYADAAPTLALAAALATEAGADLHGLMVEDDAHLALCALSAACIVDPAGRVLARHDAARMRAAVQRDAARFKQELAIQATRTALGWSFGRGSGRLGAVLAGTLTAGDMLVLPAGPTRAPLREIVLLQTGVVAGLGPLAHALAARLSRPLRTLPDGPEALHALGPGSVVIGAVSAADLPGLLARSRCTYVLRAQ